MQSSDLQNLKRQFAQSALFLVLHCVAIGVIYLDQIADTPSKFAEGSYTELFQQIYIGLTGILFFLATRQSETFRTAGILLTHFAFIAFVRELDLYMDDIFHGFWKVPAFLLLSNLLRLLIKNRKSIIPSFSAYTKESSYGVILTGATIVFVFSRLFGKGKFIMNLMGESYSRNVKNFAEEGTELLGYSIIFMAAIKFLLDQRASKSKV